MASLTRSLIQSRANPAYARIVQEQVAGAGPHFELVSRHLQDVFALAEVAMGELLPEEGALSLRHFHLTLSAAVVNYFSYAPALGRVWRKPFSPRVLAERRQHLRWLVDALLDALMVHRSRSPNPTR